MVMRICHSRQHGRSVQVDHPGLRTLIGLDGGAGPDKDNSISLHSDGIRMGLAIVCGVDVAVDKDQLGGLNLVTGGHKVEEQNTEQDGKDFHCLPLSRLLTEQKRLIYITVRRSLCNASVRCLR